MICSAATVNLYLLLFYPDVYIFINEHINVVNVTFDFIQTYTPTLQKETNLTKNTNSLLAIDAMSDMYKELETKCR